MHRTQPISPMHGSAVLDLYLAADGQVGAFWEQDLSLYGIAAGVLIAAEAGVATTDFKGNPSVFPSQVLAANGKLLNQPLPAA